MSNEEKSFLRQWLIGVSITLTASLMTFAVVLIWTVSSVNTRFEQLSKTMDEIAPQHRVLWYDYENRKGVKE